MHASGHFITPRRGGDTRSILMRVSDCLRYRFAFKCTGLAHVFHTVSSNTRSMSCGDGKVDLLVGYILWVVRIVHRSGREQSGGQLVIRDTV
jgi:hypothetical protein